MESESGTTVSLYYADDFTTCEFIIERFYCITWQLSTFCMLVCSQPMGINLHFFMIEQCWHWASFVHAHFTAGGSLLSSALCHDVQSTSDHESQCYWNKTAHASGAALHKLTCLTANQTRARVSMHLRTVFTNHTQHQVSCVHALSSEFLCIFTLCSPTAPVFSRGTSYHKVCTVQ